MPLPRVSKHVASRFAVAIQTEIDITEDLRQLMESDNPEILSLLEALKNGHSENEKALIDFTAIAIYGVLNAQTQEDKKK